MANCSPRLRLIGQHVWRAGADAVVIYVADPEGNRLKSAKGTPVIGGNGGGPASTLTRSVIILSSAN